MTRARFDDALHTAVIAIGAAAIAFPLSQYRSFPVDFTHLAVFVAGGVFVIVLEVLTVAFLLRLESVRQDRDQVALSEGHRAAHGGKL